MSATYIIWAAPKGRPRVERTIVATSIDEATKLATSLGAKVGTTNSGARFS